jgi:hypothetical protein
MLEIKLFFVKLRSTQVCRSSLWPLYIGAERSWRYTAVTHSLVLTIFTQRANPNDDLFLLSNMFTTVTFIFKHVAFGQSLKENFNYSYI